MDGSQLGIGKTIAEGSFIPDRDAIHVAVIAVRAGDTLRPAQHVYRGVDGTFYPEGYNSMSGPAIGVVDPYLKQNSVNKGTYFWLFLYPGSITSLSHQWTHPAFGAADLAPDSVIAQAAARVKEFAGLIGQSYDKLMGHADHWKDALEKEGGKSWDLYVNMGDNEEYNNASSSQWQDFWKDYNIIRKASVPIDTGHYFTCAC